MTGADFLQLLSAWVFPILFFLMITLITYARLLARGLDYLATDGSQRMGKHRRLVVAVAVGLVAIAPLFAVAQAPQVAAAESNTATVSDHFTSNQLRILCRQFLSHGITALKNKFAEYGTTLEDGYHQVRCEDGQRDLIKFRMMNYRGRSDLAAFILHYRGLNRTDELVEIFNTVVPGPKIPHGTLIDFIEYYRAQADLNDNGKQEYARMITLLRAQGAKKASEL